MLSKYVMFLKQNYRYARFVRHVPIQRVCLRVCVRTCVCVYLGVLSSGGVPTSSSQGSEAAISTDTPAAPGEPRGEAAAEKRIRWNQPQY